jgi:hypothetical protein
MPSDSIFLNLNLPNAATWFYFSALLAVALFFKFSRLLSMRNLDIVMVFLSVPGLLLLAEPGGANIRAGYIWLVGTTGYFFVRCIVDLALVRRPVLSPNLNLAGLAWLAGTLYVSLVAVAARHPDERTVEGATEREDRSPTVIDEGVKSIIRTSKVPVPSAAMGQEEGLWVERVLTLACHLAIVVGLILIGWRHFDDIHAGMAMGTFYLLLPYTHLLMPGRAPHVGRWDYTWPTALMVWAVLAYRRPTVAGLLLGLAAGSVFFPVVILPIWFSFYWRRGARRFGIAFAVSAGLCLAIVSGLLLAERESLRGLQSAWSLAGWLPWQQPPPGTVSLWQGPDWSIHWAYRLPVFFVYATFLLATLFWPTPKNLAHVVSLSAAALLGLEFWYADRGGVHVLWYLPLLLLLAFRPNLTACQPHPPRSDDWLARLGRHAGRLALRPFRAPRAASPVG